jgi:hypothetical protein
MGHDESLAQQPSGQNNRQEMGPDNKTKPTSSSAALRQRTDFRPKQERNSLSGGFIFRHQTRGCIEGKTCFDEDWMLRTCRWHPQRFQCGRTSVQFAA